MSDAPAAAPCLTEGRVSSRVKLRVEEVGAALQDDTRRLWERAGRLDDLEGRSDRLARASDDFRTAAAGLRGEARWSGTRGRVALAGLCGLVFLLLIVRLSLKYRSTD